MTCICCGEERWVAIRKGKPISERCQSCAAIGNKNRFTIYNAPRGEKHPNFGKKNKYSCAWKGGKMNHPLGYVLIWIDQESPFASMRRPNGYLFEHRLVMAQHLNRCLKKWEYVHHINGIGNDNRTENLMIVTASQHKKLREYIVKLWIKEHLDTVEKVSREFLRRN